MILQKIKKSIEKIGIPCFLDYNDATSYCAVLIPETNGKESIKVDIQFIWEDGNPILLADEWIKSLRMNKELKAIVLGSGNNYAGYVLRVKVIDVSICSYIPIDDSNKFTITIENDPAKGTATGDGMYKEGKTCTISCTPFEQYYFDSWDKFVSGEDIDWESDGTIYDNPYSFTVDQDLMFEAIYGNKYHVEVVSAGNGTVSGSGYYGPTESCTITATPNTGYHFVNWTVNGLELTTDNPYTFIPTGDITITANFAIDTYTIATGGIGGTITGSGTYNYGATCTLTATPNAGYEFRRWMEYGETISTSNPYSFTVDSNRTITADFNQLSYTVSATSSGNGSVSGGGTYNSGETVSLSATPNEGYVFVNWIENGVEVSTSNPYTFTCTENRTIVGNFAANPLKITTNGASSVILTNSNNETYTWNLSNGLNEYFGDEPGFALDEITGLKKTNTYSWNYELVSVDASSLTSWTTIQDFAFYVCNNLTSITLPDSITTVGNSAFANSGIDSLDFLPEGLTRINSNAFNSTQITSVSLPSTVVRVETDAFSGCLLLTSIAVSENISYWSRTYNVPNLTSITVDSNNTVYNDGNGSNCIIKTANDELVLGCKNTTIPNTVVSIGASAFSNCTGLTSITLPDSITYIGSSAFQNSGLTSINIPKNVNSIESYAFSIPDLASITVDSNNTVYNDGNGSNCIIKTSTNVLVCGCSTTTIPNTVVEIGDYSFSNNYNLTSITIPTSVNRIGQYVFQGTGLTNPVIPSSVNYIGHCAFWNMSYCMYIEFEGTTPATLGSNSIFSSSFPIYVPSSAVSDYQTAWPTYASRIMAKPEPTGSDYLMVVHGYDMQAKIRFTNANNDTYDWTVNQGINYYNGEEPGFAINEITGIKARGISGFYSYIKSIDASKLTSITTIEYQAFSGCSGLISFILPSSLTTIEREAFSNCQSLTSITIPNSVSVINQDAFNSCQSLTSVSLSNSLTTLGRGSFMGCQSLTSITLPNTLTTLGTQTFANCKLTSLTIPASILTIGDAVFVNCPLQSLTVLATTPPTTGYSFDGSYPIYVPSASLSDYEVAPVWNYYYGLGRIQPTP